MHAPYCICTVITKFLVDSILIDPLQKPAPPPLHVTMELLWSFRGMQLLIVLIQVALFTLSEDIYNERDDLKQKEILKLRDKTLTSEPFLNVLFSQFLSLAVL